MGAVGEEKMEEFNAEPPRLPRARATLKEHGGDCFMIFELTASS